MVYTHFLSPVFTHCSYKPFSVLPIETARSPPFHVDVSIEGQLSVTLSAIENHLDDSVRKLKLRSSSIFYITAYSLWTS